MTNSIDTNLISESIFIRALRRKPVPRTPVWLMRQAGRYLPEYRELRKKAGDFLTLCKDPALACEITLQPLRRFPLDAAIIFSDILTIPDAMGLGLSFVEGSGPRFQFPLQSKQAIDALIVPNALEKLGYVLDAIRLARSQLPTNIPLIGFAGSPWTLACYMIEGGNTNNTFMQARQLLYSDKQTMHCLLTKLKLALIDYCSEQIKAGANVLMIFDTWGGILTTDNFKTFSLNYMADLVKQLKINHPTTPIILFTKGGGLWLQDMAAIGCEALGLDWNSSLKNARLQVGHLVALQGNLDPAILLCNHATICQEVKGVLSSYGHGHGHIFNLGHGITPNVNPDSVAVMIDAVHNYSLDYHNGYIPFANEF